MISKFSQFSLNELMPHAEPMILLDHLIDAGEEFAVCEVNIGEQSMFFDKSLSGVPAWIGIEYMAQSISVFAGVAAKLKGESVKVGFLLGSRRYESDVVTFKQGCKLKITVNRLYQEDSGLAGFDCTISCQELPICNAKLNVFSPDDASEFFASTK